MCARGKALLIATAHATAVELPASPLNDMIFDGADLSRYVPHSACSPLSLNANLDGYGGQHANSSE
jgi:hypothetical protein